MGRGNGLSSGRGASEAERPAGVEQVQACGAGEPSGQPVAGDGANRSAAPGTAAGSAGTNSTPTLTGSASGLPPAATGSGKVKAATPAAARGVVTVAEYHLMERVFAVCDRLMRAACAFSSVPVEFLAALTANESGGDAHAMRFEPAVYDHLAAVARGLRPAYGALGRKAIEAEVQDALHPKTDEYHAHFLTDAFAQRSASAQSGGEDEVLRELATSWGFTQIMGYHMVWRGGAPRDLLDPGFHFLMTLELLTQFAESYQLDVRSEFREMFGCWNTGRPYGQTADPRYVENGLRRMAIYRQVAASRSQKPGTPR
jgi:hypothetical protein